LIPISLAERITRRAISPRLATKIFFKGCVLMLMNEFHVFHLSSAAQFCQVNP
jgi:hypothetical protein